MSEYNWIIPSVDAVPEAADVILAHQVTYDFYQEVEHRETYKRYVQWYRDLSHQHQQELKAMRRDPNLLGWFVRSHY